MAKTISRNPCPVCHSKDNLSSFIGNDGQIKFKCMTPDCPGPNDPIRTPNQYDNEPTTVKSTVSITGTYKNYRGISARICEKLGISIPDPNTTECLAIYEHRNLDGSTDIKYRWPNKKFSWAQPSSPNKSMFALDKCRDFNKPLIITEGNEDAATYWELGYQACSILSAGSEILNIKQDIETIYQYPEVWLSIDNDSAGKAALNNIQKLLKNTNLKVINLAPYKDANECLEKDIELLKQRLKEVEENVPPGIVFGDQLDFEGLWINPKPGLSLPWKNTSEKLFGLERGQLYTLLGGSSIGKSTVLRELGYHLRITYPNLRIANVFCEESKEISQLAYLAIHLNIPLGKLKANRDLIPLEKREEIIDTLIRTPNLMFIDRGFDRTINSFLNIAKYLSFTKYYDIIILDHISYLIGNSNLGSSGERRDLDTFLYKLQNICLDTGCIIVAASHITESKQKDKDWDEGAVPGQYSGRGSKALAQVPDGVIAVSRNMRSEYNVDCLDLHILKNRWGSKVGKTDSLVYIEETGRLVSK